MALSSRREAVLAGARLEHVLEVGADRCRPSSRRSPAARAPASLRRLRARPRSAAAPAPADCGSRWRKRPARSDRWFGIGHGNQLSGLGVAHRIGIGHAEPRQDRGLEPFHRLGFLVWPHDRSRRDGEIHAPPDGRDDARTACPRPRLRAPRSRRRSRCRRAVRACAAVYAWLLRRKRQHVGRLVLAAPVAVERADRRIIGQHDRKLADRLLTPSRRPRRSARRSIASTPRCALPERGIRRRYRSAGAVGACRAARRLIPCSRAAAP